MSSESENKSQSNSVLSRLVQANAASIQKIETTPYQPIVYAIPEEQRMEELKLLRQAVAFQPTLYQQISQLATWHSISEHCKAIQNVEAEYMNWTVEQLTSANQQTVQKMQESVSQAGKKQENFISEAEKLLQSSTQSVEKAMVEAAAHQRKIMHWTAVISVLLSVLVCVVFWKLVP